MTDDTIKAAAQTSGEPLNIAAADPKTVEISKEMISAGVLYVHAIKNSSADECRLFSRPATALQLFDLNAFR